MRDPGRIDPTIDLIWDIWHAQPDLRLGQIIENAYRLAGASTDLYNIEDAPLIVGLHKQLALIETARKTYNPITSSTPDASE